MEAKSKRAAPLKPLIFAMLAERGGEPITSIEVSRRAGVARMTGWQAMHRLVASGDLHAIEVGHDRLYFRNRADADRYSAHKVAEFRAAQVALRTARLVDANKRLGRFTPKPKAPKVKAKPVRAPALPAPVVIRQAPAPVEIDYSRAKFTWAAAPLGRFEVDSGHRGPFSLVGLGRDVETGAGWGA